MRKSKSEQKVNLVNRKLIILDIVCFVMLPLVIWNNGRVFFSDYIAMLLSTVPGFMYTIYRFRVERQFHITGLFIITSLFIGTTVDLLSGSAERMLWNQIYLGLFYVVVHFIALVIRRPFALYFAVDFVYLQGHPREETKRLFYQKGIFMWFQMIQLLFVIRGLFMAGLNTWLLKTYGVDGYNQMIIYRQIAGWFFGLLVAGMYIYINVPVRNYFQKQDAKTREKAEQI